MATIPQYIHLNLDISPRLIEYIVKQKRHYIKAPEVKCQVTHSYVVPNFSITTFLEDFKEFELFYQGDTVLEFRL
jgi:hypothetical protein